MGEYMPSYTSFCWSLGTTSFRTKEFNLKIEQQLELLTEFWMSPENEDQQWSGNESIQTKYYNFIKTRGFVTEDAPNKPKDAREKTSGLADMGLIDDERRLTGAGNALLDIVRHEAFGADNNLQLANDSYIYFKQVAKTASEFDGGFVRPYIVTAYIMSKLGALSEDEFTFLVPLVTSAEKLEQVMNAINDARAGKNTVDAFILDTLMAMPNYKKALTLWQNSEVSEELVMEIGMNRKSRTYDKPYFNLYTTLKSLVFFRNKNDVEPLLDAIDEVNMAKYWKQLLFTTPKRAQVMKEKLGTINFDAVFFSAKNESEFKDIFFKIMHLYKAKATLSDYFDLNRRYLKTTDTVVFKNNTVDFDVIPKCYFSLIEDKLLKIAFTAADNLYENCEFVEIIPDSEVGDELLFAKIEKVYPGVKVKSTNDVKKFIEDEHTARFNEMIDRKFPKDALLNLLKYFKVRDDDKIQKMVTSNADVPTIFEYIIGIIWYNISERRVNVLEAFNLSLDSDLLPKTHAKGGREDLTYLYETTADYPTHTLLLEVTLTENTNQRRIEMEPVSRHLGDFLLRNKNMKTYCVFVSTYLHVNVIGDFRSRKTLPYYSTNGKDCVNGMEILPCSTEEL